MSQRVAGGGRWTNALPVSVLGTVLTLAVWAYWTTLAEAAEHWAHDPQYSHGYLVPAFSLVLLWLRQHKLPADGLRPNWWGLPLVAAGIGLRLFGAFYYYAWLDAVSLLPCLAGLAVLAGGFRAGRWAWPSIAFLGFMIPLPYRLEVMMGAPLQRLATAASTFALQTLGLPALAEGTVILLNEVRINIVEACSGLRMLVIFTALSTAVALVVKRPLWERLVIVASAVPIALVSNITRITATGLLHHAVGSAIANAVFHDLAGWLMMPFALALLAVELAVLKNLFLEAPPARNPVALGFTGLPPSFRRPRRKPWSAPAGQASPPPAEAPPPRPVPNPR